MVAKAQRRATYEDVKNAPLDQVAEVILGVLHVNPRPALAHANASSVLGADLTSAFHRGRGGPGGWIILDEPELHLGPEPDIVVPDLAGWRRARLPALPAEPFLKLPPDWSCEVLSARTSRIDRSDKMDVYLREGVGHVWLVDPSAKTLEIYRRAPTTDGTVAWVRVAVHRDDARVRAEPFDAIELELAALWLGDPSPSEE